MSYKSFFKYWFPVILWVGCIFWMSTGTFAASNTSIILEPILRFLMPNISMREVHLIHEVIRKLSHVTVYFVLGLLLFRAFRNDSNDMKTWRWILYSVLALAIFAAGDEFHQSFVSTRNASLVDVGIDTLGGFLAQCSILLRNRVYRLDS